MQFGLYDPQFERDACGVGFVAHIKGEKSRGIVEQALEVLRRLSHRAAAGRDPETGDGAGILLQLPHRFFKRVGTEMGFEMPRRRRYAVGMVFLPQDEGQRRACEAAFEAVVREEGQQVIGWRDVPVDPDHLGPLSRSLAPVVRQIFIGRRRIVPSAFERRLFVIRRLVEKRIRADGLDAEGRFHVASLSSETIVYKGLLLPKQLPRFYPDLGADDMVSAIGLVHSRFSTNTFPTWDLAQPMRYVAHNGEINTVQGNRNWMRARGSQLRSAKFDDLSRLFPIIVPGRSDSSQFDNMLELLVLGGRTLPHSIMMMIPEAWERNHAMEAQRRAFYEYTAALMEPWDGPAAIAFTDGTVIGATLDRNGLRPCRYVITDDDRIVLASEIGVMDVDPARIRQLGRLQSGRMLVVDTEEGVIHDDDAVKSEITRRFPYRRWLDKNLFEVGDMKIEAAAAPPITGDALRVQLRAFGYTDEDLNLLLRPMARAGKEPTGSMGNDTPIAALSDRAPSLFDYFKQRFAQVTNPPIDPIREALVMSLSTAIGPDGNTFEETPEQCHRLSVDGPVLTNEALARVRCADVGVFESVTLSTVFPVAQGPGALRVAVDAICKAAEDAVCEGYSILILSDRAVDAQHAPIPALLALSAVHQHLVREGIRMQTGLVVETGEAREVHHLAALLSFGAAAVNPYLAFDALREEGVAGRLEGPFEAAERAYVKALCAGLLKVMSKMGISTLQSYRGAQMFEAIGLKPTLVAQHFTGTPRQLSGVGLSALGREALTRHARGFRAQHTQGLLPVGGRYQWRRQGEHHRWNPATIAHLQDAASTGNAKAFQRYEALLDSPSPVAALRSLLEFVERPAVPLEEVEPASAIVKRFVTGAMSFGSLGPEAHENLAIAMNRLGGRSNSGEGGEEPHRNRLDPNGDSRRSKIRQIASGRFGVTVDYLVRAEDLQIKMAQGAKPGEGGQLPGDKVDARIARVRCSTKGVSLISPPPHHDIYSIEDLKQLIDDLRAVNPEARVSVKLVAQAGVGTVAAGVVKAGADVVVISGASGGTGASPQSSIQHAGSPWELGLAEAQQVLMYNGLRGRVRLQADGGLRTGRDVIVAAALGAEEFGFATSALVAAGCVLLRKCHLNTCSMGIATQDPELRARFTGTPEQVVQFLMFVAESVRAHLARLGLRSLDELIGRVDLLRPRTDIEHWKLGGLDISALVAAAPVEDEPRRDQRAAWNPAPECPVTEQTRSAWETGVGGKFKRTIDNTQRSVGARLSGKLIQTHPAGLPDGAIDVTFTGTAGQSFGAFLAAGVAFTLVGPANDYVGKGLSGGRVAVRPPLGVRFAPEDNIIIGNTTLYGATAGELFVNGQAGERFAVRNSGARAVVEGVGDHGCEYMTGGTVVVLGSTGRNFGAGMSGGVAFVYDRDGRFRRNCNLEMVDLEGVDESDSWLVRTLLEDHKRYTGSPLATRLLDHWPVVLPRFVKVMPYEYRRALEEMARAEKTSPERRGEKQAG